MTVIEKMIETLADIRNATTEQIKQELINDDQSTHNELFKLVCAFKACE